MLLPKLPSFFKTPAHRQFNYKARYVSELKMKSEEKKGFRDKSKNIRFGEQWQPIKRTKAYRLANKIVFYIKRNPYDYFHVSFGSEIKVMISN